MYRNVIYHRNWNGTAVVILFHAFLPWPASAFSPWYNTLNWSQLISTLHLSMLQTFTGSLCAQVGLQQKSGAPEGSRIRSPAGGCVARHPDTQTSSMQDATKDMFYFLVAVPHVPKDFPRFRLFHGLCPAVWRLRAKRCWMPEPQSETGNANCNAFAVKKFTVVLGDCLDIYIYRYI